MLASRAAAKRKKLCVLSISGLLNLLLLFEMSNAFRFALQASYSRGDIQREMAASKLIEASIRLAFLHASSLELLLLGYAKKQIRESLPNS